jgi:predicted RNase H-like HicB family nuclease
MRFHVDLQISADGQYVAQCDNPQVRALGRTAASALDQLREGLRYHLEMCPCSTVDPGQIELDVD